jgi:hypothetical protein
MDSEGRVYPIPYGRHDQWVKNLLFKFCKKSRELRRWYNQFENEEAVIYYFYTKGWLRLGIIDWSLDVWPTKKWNKRQRVALASWRTGGPGRTISLSDYVESVVVWEKESE